MSSALSIHFEAIMKVTFDKGQSVGQLNKYKYGNYYRVKSEFACDQQYDIKLRPQHISRQPDFDSNQS